MVDRERLDQAWSAFWERENHTRPVMSVIAPKEGAVRRKAIHVPAVPRDRWLDIDCLLARVHHEMETTYYGGEAFPCATVDFGPDLLGVLCGCELDFGWDTTWAKHFVTGSDSRSEADCRSGPDWTTLPPLAFDAQNPWFMLLQDMTAALAADAQKHGYLAGVTDLHSGLDGLVSLRGPQGLCMDLYDCPEAIPPRVDQMLTLHKAVLQAQLGAIAACQTGCTNWMSILHPIKRWYVTSCDFSALISAEQFETFAIPGLLAELEMLPASIYHLDGPDALKHLDRLLAIPNLNGIQWVQGAGSPPAREWIPVYQKIQAAGKLIVADCQPADIEPLCRALKPEGVYLSCYTRTEADARNLIALAERVCAKNSPQ